MLDKHQEEFSEILTVIPLVYLETGDGWSTWNNWQGGENFVSSWIDIFLVLENIVQGSGEIRESVLPAMGFDHWPISHNWD